MPSPPSVESAGSRAAAATPHRGAAAAPAGFIAWLLSVPPSVIVILALTAAVSMLVLGVSEYASREINTNRLVTSQLRQAERDLYRLSDLLTLAEASERGYLLTWDPRYLQPYQHAVDEVRRVQDDLLTSLGGHALYRDDYKLLTDLVRRKVDELNVSVHQARNGRVDDAMDSVRSGASLALTQQVRERQFALAHRLKTSGMSRLTTVTRLINQQRWAVAFTVGLNLVFLALLGARMMQQFSERERKRSELAAQAARLEQAVVDRTADLRSLSTYLQNHAEHEKAELARDLHDEFGGLLTSAKVDVAWLQGRDPGSDPERTRRLTRLSDALDEAVQLKRRVIENLRPSLLDHLGLGPALTWYVEETCAKAGLEPRVDVPEDTSDVPPPVATAIYRIVQESLTNTIKHARARRLIVRLTAEPDEWRLSIEDDGTGIHNFQPLHLTHGLGGMRHRAEALGGALHIDTATGRGTRVSVAIPRPVQQAAATPATPAEPACDDDRAGVQMG